MSSVDYGRTAQALIEAELGRGLWLEERTEIYPAAMRIPLRAWPVEAVSSIEPLGRWDITPDGAELLAGAMLNEESGILTLPGLKDTVQSRFWRTWREKNVDEVDGPLLRITYTGGYNPLPAPIVAACELIATALKTAADNGGQQITFQALDGYQVTYSSRYQEGNSLTMLSPAAAILIAPFRREYKS